MRERIRERMIFREHGKTPWDVANTQDPVQAEEQEDEEEHVGQTTNHIGNVDLDEWHTLFEAPKHDEVRSPTPVSHPRQFSSSAHVSRSDACCWTRSRRQDRTHLQDTGAPLPNYLLAA